jgi:hypothetical protein
MMGDFAGFCSRRLLVLPSTQTFTTTTLTPFTYPVGMPVPGRPPLTITIFIPSTTVATLPSTQCVYVCDPLLARAGSGFKIADCESPLPQDRVFVTYNYFDRLAGMGGFTPASTVNFTNPDGSKTVVEVPAAAALARNANLNRELFGLEKTFLDGDASVELRVPIFQTTSSDSLNGEDFGDLTVVLKYAPYRDPRSGNCLSAGLAVTVPTGPGIPTFDGTIHDVLFQPFVGGSWSEGDLFVQGFSAAVIPTDSRDVTLLFNDVSIGYSLYRGCRDRCLTYVAPALEAHVTTPLDHRASSSTIVASDIVDLTPVLYIGLGERLLLSGGVSFPVTGAQAFNCEALVQVNFRF